METQPIKLRFFTTLFGHISPGNVQFYRQHVRVGSLMLEWANQYGFDYTTEYIAASPDHYSKSFNAYHHYLVFDTEEDLVLFKLKYSEELRECLRAGWGC